MTDIIVNQYPAISISGEHAGMNIVISVPHDLSENQLKERAAEHNIGVYPMSDYMITPIESETPKFLLGFGGLDLDMLEDAIHHLMTIWGIERTNPN